MYLCIPYGIITSSTNKYASWTPAASGFQFLSTNLDGTPQDPWQWHQREPPASPPTNTWQNGSIHQFLAFSIFSSSGPDTFGTKTIDTCMILFFFSLSLSLYIYIYETHLFIIYTQWSKMLEPAQSPKVEQQISEIRFCWVNCFQQSCVPCYPQDHPTYRRGSSGFLQGRTMANTPI